MKFTNQLSVFFVFTVLITIISINTYGQISNEGRIKIYEKNSFYWQYKGKPVLLLGASNYDNIFQLRKQELAEHLDLMKSLGGNYVRNTMASRDYGDLWPYQIVQETDDSLTNKYDLSRWNDEYWEHFEQFLEETNKRDLIVEIELWDRHDFYRVKEQGGWLYHPYNPDNNNNYTSMESGLPTGDWDWSMVYRDTRHPFFATVPRLQNFVSRPKSKLVLDFQQAYIDKLLSYSLKYDHILYNMSNEIQEHHFWGEYWAKYVLGKAEAAGKQVELTDMQDAWETNDPSHKIIVESEIYTFVDISQNNFQSGETHWKGIQYIRNSLLSNPKPITNIKIYGSDVRYGGNSEGVQRFWRNIFGGCSSARFHRPEGGIGLTPDAQANLKSLRMLTDAIDIFNYVPANELLKERSKNEAYCMARSGKEYVVYFPAGGSVKVEVEPGGYEMKWLRVNSSEWQKEKTEKLPGYIQTPNDNAWTVLIKKI
ncbi:MAG: hypothetical protein ACQEQ0_03835 [Bacteroidota bacterium]